MILGLLLLAPLSAVLNASLSPATAAESVSPFHKVPASALPEVGLEGDLETFKTALRRQITRCKEQDLKAKFRFGDRVVTRQEWCVETNQKFLALAQSASDFPELMRRARDQFEWYQTDGRDGKGEVLFTGYNSPTLHGSLTPTSEYSAPLYKRPADLVQVVENGKSVWRKKNPDGTISKHFTRREIDIEGALKGKGLELAYSTDFFSISKLQTEGSGIFMLRHPDGSVERRFINYAASNGHPWVSLTQILREDGVPEESLSLQGIRRYFAAHPEKMMPALAKNPSYVYFQFASNGPFGCDSVQLSARHSIAIDLRQFPQGAVTFFQTKRPEFNGEDFSNWRDFSTLAVTQDTGGAIVGPGRVDFYLGDDDYAELASNKMHSLGTLFMALAPESKP